jgi:hypothetical protein
LKCYITNFFVYLKNLKVKGSYFCSWRLKVLDFIHEGGRFLFLEVEGSWFMFCYFSWHVIFVHLCWLLLSLCFRAKFWIFLNLSKLKLCIKKKWKKKWWFCLNYIVLSRRTCNVMLYNLVRLLIAIIECVVVCCVIIQTNTCKNKNSKTIKVWWILTSILQVCDAFYFKNHHCMQSVVDLI